MKIDNDHDSSELENTLNSGSEQFYATNEIIDNSFRLKIYVDTIFTGFDL